MVSAPIQSEKVLEIAKSLKVETATALTDQNNRAMISILEKNDFSFSDVGWMINIREEDDDENFLSSVPTVVEYRKVLK